MVFVKDDPVGLVNQGMEKQISAHEFVDFITEHRAHSRVGIEQRPRVEIDDVKDVVTCRGEVLKQAPVDRQWFTMRAINRCSPRISGDVAPSRGAHRRERDQPIAVVAMAANRKFELHRRAGRFALMQLLDQRFCGGEYLAKIEAAR